jgi:hypothetical protein
MNEMQEDIIKQWQTRYATAALPLVAHLLFKRRQMFSMPMPSADQELAHWCTHRC